MLWFLNVVTGLDINDIRYGPCAMCSGMKTSDETRTCEGCEVYMCDDCFRANSGDDDRDPEWWPQSLNDPDCYCDKCVKAVHELVTVPPANCASTDDPTTNGVTNEQ